MLEKIKILLGITDDSKDTLLNTYITICQDEAITYCNLDVYTTKLDSTIIEMVIEKYNRRGSEGVSSTTSSGISEEYFSEYSPMILCKLRKNRKVRYV